MISNVFSVLIPLVSLFIIYYEIKICKICDKQRKRMWVIFFSIIAATHILLTILMRIK